MRADQVQPITQQERAHCAYCAKPLQPNHGCRVTFYSGTTDAKGRTPEQQLAEYQTNRRVVRIANSYHQPTDYEGTKTGPRVVTRIEITHYPDDPRDWGFWGMFCGQQCAARFGYAAHRAGYRAGYRIQRKST